MWIWRRLLFVRQHQWSLFHLHSSFHYHALVACKVCFYPPWIWKEKCTLKIIKQNCLKYLKPHQYVFNLKKILNHKTTANLWRHSFFFSLLARFHWISKTIQQYVFWKTLPTSLKYVYIYITDTYPLKLHIQWMQIP